MLKIKTFFQPFPSDIDSDVNAFLAKYKDAIEIVDIKTNVTIEPAGGFVEPRGFTTQPMYTYIVIYKEKE